MKLRINETPNSNDIKLIMKDAANVTTQRDLTKILGSLLSIDKDMYKHYSEMARNTDYSPSYIGKLISDDLYYWIN